MSFFKAAVLFKQKKPLKFVQVETPVPQNYQVLVKIFYSGFCSSQHGEIEGLKGKDNFLPHLLGHEACGKVIKIGEKVKKVKSGDLVVMHWMKAKGQECSKIIYTGKNGLKINSGKITTFSNLSIVSENRITKINKKEKFQLKYLPLMGCSIPVALSTIEKIIKPKKNKNILILGSGALGLPMIHYCKHKKLNSIDVLEKAQISGKKARKFGATAIFKNIKEVKLVQNLKKNYYEYIVDTTGSSKLISGILNYPVICRFAFLGVPHFSEKIKFNSLKINYGLKLLGSYGGNFNPDKDLLKYLKFLKKSKFNYKTYIDKIYNFKKINTLIKDFKDKKIFGKALIKF
jgi:S-(hydroxymethyl)glutathione dehydrogenase/alcohol dehydrogenase